MLSPGLWHKKVPKDLLGNLKFRQAILLRAQESDDIRHGLWTMCGQDILFYINCFVWQTNPNKAGGEIGPFITWPFQDRAIVEEGGILWRIENRKDLLVEKSREMGITWIFLIVMDWLCRFRPYHDSLMMSKSSQAVDSPTRQSLFGKLRFIHEHLPLWLHNPSPKVFIDNKMNMIYPVTNSTVTGFSSTGRAGVSERGSEMFVDEASQIEEMAEVYYRIASTTKCRMINGTHLGMGNFFYTLSKDESLNKIQFHWTQHPDKNRGLYKWDTDKHRPIYLKYLEETEEIVETKTPDYDFHPDYPYDQTGNPVGGPHPSVRSPWYDHEFIRIGRNLVEMAKDHDINPSGSVAQFYSALVIRQLKIEYADNCPPFWEGELVYDKDTAMAKCFSRKAGGKLKLWLHLREGRPPYSTYGCGVDVGQGTGATPSCISIVDGRTGEKVVEYQDAHIDPKELGQFCVALCKMFCDEQGNGAKIGWEHHGPGTAFGQMVWKTLNYRQIYYKTSESSLGQKVSDIPGWSPTHGQSLQLHADYRTALYERRFLNRSAKALDETLNFKHTDRGSVEHTLYQNKENPAAARENHGDIVIADALACKMVKLADRLVEIAPPVNELREKTFLGRRRMRDASREYAW